MTPSVISLDWLSGTGNLTRSPDEITEPHWAIEYHPHGTRVYDTWATFSYRNRPVLDLLFKPKTPILSPTSCHWKLHNSFLYQYHGINSNYQIFDFFGIHNARPTRVDVCCDFHTFKNGLSPSAFIEHICNGKIVRKGGRRFTIYGNNSTKPSFYYLRFGSHTSPVSLLLYNKSQEFREVADKPWIREVWRRRNLCDQVDVWRLEFSITDTRLRFKNTRSNEEFSIHQFIYSNQSMIESIFHACLNRYACFLYPSGKKRADRMKQLDLFDIVMPEISIYLSDPLLQSNNLTKYVIKQLKFLEQEARINRHTSADEIARCISIYEHIHGLSGYSDNLKQ